MSTQSLLNDITTPAQNIFDTIDISEKVVAHLEEISHDGYSQDGPQTNIWDLFFITLKDKYYIFYYYQWEDWFHEKTVKKYNLVKKNYVKNIILNQFLFEKVKTLSKQDTSLKHFVNSLKLPVCIFRIFKMFINTNAFAYYQSANKSYLMFNEEDQIKINEFDNNEIYKHYQLFKKMITEKVNTEKENNKEYNIFVVKSQTKSSLVPSNSFLIKDIKKHINKEKIIKWLTMSSTI